MRTTLHTALLSTALLLSACSPKPEATNPTTPPANQPVAVPTPAPVAAPAPLPDASGNPVAAPKVTPAANPLPAVPTPIADLGKVLGNIKDGATAAAAKGGLDALVQQLSAAKTAATGGAEGGLGGLSKLATGAAAKAGLSPDVMATIQSLLDNPTIKAVIGPTLEKLQGLLK